MENSQQFIKAVSNINWNKYTRISGNNEMFTSDNGFSLSYSFTLQTDESLPSVQIVAQIRYNDAYVMSWGFTDEASQRQFIELLYKVRSRLNEDRLREQGWNSNIGREMFK